MPKYEALDSGVSLRAGHSDLDNFQWAPDGISADFIMPDDEGHLLRVSFDRPCIVRLLDEMSLSTEEDDTPINGLVPEHFAYRVVDALFHVSSLRHGR